MSNLEDLAKIQQALGSLQSNNPIDELTANKLLKEANISSAINSADLIRIGKTQSDISQVLGGESLDFGSITRLSDCIKNIDDIIIDRLTKKLTSLLLQNSTVSAALATATNVMAVINTVNGYIAFVQSLLDKSFLELLILAKDAGILERSEIFRQIQEKYGSTINNLNEILANIDNLNICTMMGLGGGPVPSGVKNMKPEALPDFGSFIKVDTASLEKKQKYEDVISRIGFEITNVIDFVPNQLAGVLNRAPQTPPAVNDALSHLQNFSRAVINRYGVASDDEVTKLRALFNAEIDRKISEYSYEWSPETREFYKQKAQYAILIAESEHKTLSEWNIVKNNNYQPGQRVSTGISKYGDPRWDLTTFIDLVPSERAKVIGYPTAWTPQYIASQEASMIARDYPPRTLTDISDSYTGNGEYGGQILVSGYSCATSRWPGGTKLQLKNPDGSIYDPAGLNPSGIVTVVDTGPAKKKETWNKIDVYIKEPSDAAKYRNSTLAGVEVYLVEMGTKTSKKYNDAHAFAKMKKWDGYK
jgi:hypothetical protein